VGDCRSHTRLTQSCIHMNQAHGDLVRRTIWLSTWAAGTIPKKMKGAEPMIRKPPKSIDSIRRSNNDSYDEL
jgi:hypothetical protein